MAPLAVTPGALAKIADGSLEDGQRCTLQVIGVVCNDIYCCAASSLPPPAVPSPVRGSRLFAATCKLMAARRRVFRVCLAADLGHQGRGRQAGAVPHEAHGRRHLH